MIDQKFKIGDRVFNPLGIGSPAGIIVVIDTYGNLPYSIQVDFGGYLNWFRPSELKLIEEKPQ